MKIEVPGNATGDLGEDSPTSVQFPMRIFGITIFLSAFLLFQIQPMIAKAILPWYGSSPAVWTTCMLFFQSLLLAGYGYAHLSVTWLPRRMQGLLHLVLLIVAAATLPISPQQPAQLTSGDPTWQILTVLATSVGLPYTLLSASGPLFQAWFGFRFPGRGQYRLYALSNIGSLTALLTYPLVVEPTLRVGQQSWAWSIGFGALLLSAAGCAWSLFRAPAEEAAGTSQVTTPAAFTSGGQTQPAPPTWRQLWLWLAYALTGSVVLLAITNQICQDIAVVPFLWVLPLTAYLVSFILCFDSDGWYRRGPYLLGAIVGTGLVSITMMGLLKMSLWPQIALYVGVAFVSCMCCHGELARLRPAPRWSTLFFLMVSIGGALGGFFVAIIAPQIFLRYWELDLGLAATCLLTWIAMVRESREPVPAPQLSSAPVARRRRKSRDRMEEPALPTKRSQWPAITLGLLILAMDVGLGIHIYREHSNIIRLERNFYGVLSVYMSGIRFTRENGKPITEFTPENLSLGLFHGVILHGMQYMNPPKKEKPYIYYHERSGVGLAIESHPERNTPNRPFKLGVIGLGTGTLAAYARPGDYIRFYEINPAVVRLAQEPQSDDGVRFFTYCFDAEQRGAKLVTSIGDARLLLNRDVEQATPEQFDVLVVDAFSGDAIPLHLLTRESLNLYFKNLAPDGIVAFHVSNLYLDLAPIVFRLATEQRASALRIVAQADHNQGIHASHWVLVTRNKPFVMKAVEWPETYPWAEAEGEGPVWTDDFSSIISAVMW